LTGFYELRHNKIMICIPIIARDNDDALKKIARAEAVGDMVELRLDVMDSFDLPGLLRASSKPVLVTYRSKREGGRGAADYSTRIRSLSMAIELGADFVDVEYHLPLEVRHPLFQNSGSSRMIISAHLLNKTPSKETLSDLLRKMAATGADVVKIVTRARTWEDNFTILQLIPKARAMGIQMIALAMGPMGRMSRIMSPIMGGFLTFASLEEGQESASGQIPALEMRNLLKVFFHDD